MTYRLYGRRQTGSMAIEAALNLIGAEWQLEEVASDPSEAERAAFQRINPRGQVPVLVHPDGTVISEGPAILVHLADAFPAAGLVPVPGSTARARHDRWLAFFHANVYEGMLREFYADRYTDDPAGVSAVQSAATSYVRRHFQIFEAEVAARIGKGFCCGDRVAALDIYIWMLCFWLEDGWLAANCPEMHALWLRTRALPALLPVEQAHFG